MPTTGRDTRTTLTEQLRELARENDPATRPDHAAAVGDRTALVTYGDAGRFDGHGFRSEPVAVEPTGDDGVWRVTSLAVGTGDVGHGDLVRIGPLPDGHRHRDALLGEVVEVVQRRPVARGRIATTDTAWVCAELAGLGDDVVAEPLGTAGVVVVQCPPQLVAAVDAVTDRAQQAGRIARSRWHA